MADHVFIVCTNEAEALRIGAIAAGQEGVLDESPNIHIFENNMVAVDKASGFPTVDKALEEMRKEAAKGHTITAYVCPFFAEVLHNRAEKQGIPLEHDNIFLLMSGAKDKISWQYKNVEVDGKPILDAFEGFDLMKLEGKKSAAEQIINGK